MIWLLITAVLIVKHVFIAYFLDIGYSRSRCESNRLWLIDLTTLLLAEVLVTATVLWLFSVQFGYSALLVEATGHGLAGLVERMQFSRRPYVQPLVAEGSSLLAISVMVLGLYLSTT